MVEEEDVLLEAHEAAYAGAASGDQDHLARDVLVEGLGGEEQPDACLQYVVDGPAEGEEQLHGGGEHGGGPGHRLPANEEATQAGWGGSLREARTGILDAFEMVISLKYFWNLLKT